MRSERQSREKQRREKDLDRVRKVTAGLLVGSDCPRVWRSWGSGRVARGGSARRGGYSGRAQDAGRGFGRRSRPARSCSRVHPCEHCRGVRARVRQGRGALPAHCPRLSGGTGESPVAGSANRPGTWAGSGGTSAENPLRAGPSAGSPSRDRRRDRERLTALLTRTSHAFASHFSLGLLTPHPSLLTSTGRSASPRPRSRSSRA